jgi:hypothetical protein
MTEIFTKALTPPRTAPDLRERFRLTKPGTVSGPSGITRGHLYHAPDFILEALLPVVADIVDGNYPDSLKLGAISPKPKDLYRFRPITLLEYLYRAVESTIATRLGLIIQELEITDTAQYGFVRGGSTGTAIDILRLIIEDATHNRKGAWIALMDCSEAFDSLDDMLTDITFRAANIPERFITWARQARRFQRRIIITAGGVSSIENAIPATGGAQGAPTMPAFWAIASEVIRRLAHSIGHTGAYKANPTQTDAPDQRPHPGTLEAQQTIFDWPRASSIRSSSKVFLSLACTP